MAENFNFSKIKIDEHTIKVGADIRPVFEPKLDRVKLFDVGQRLADKYPNLFESLVQSPTDCHIKKKFIFPGKGEADIKTLAITQRGVVFVFPLRLSIFDEETNIDTNKIDDICLDGLNIFRQAFPDKKICRVGMVNEYIFSTGPIESVELICSRFTKVNVPRNGEILLSMNRPEDDYNRKIELKAVKKVDSNRDISDISQIESYGVQVTVDFNNRDMNTDLDKNRILAILHDARQYNEKDLYDFLNAFSGGK